jgi:D-alanyl-D-alanine carboxypeptidase
MYGISIQNLRALPCVLAIVLLGVSSSAAAAGPTTSQAIEPSLQKKVDAAVEQILKRTGVPSVSIALVRDNRLIYSRAYGDARLNPRMQALSSMRYAVGSISKEFTAASLLLLQQQQRLSLDDPAGKFLDHLGPAAGVTIRQLLSHTSGVRDFWPQDYFLQDMLKPASAADIIERWGAKPLDFAPGTAWQYSNTGYTIAGAIAEKVSGHRLFEQLQEIIFQPLGMTSVVDVDRGALKPDDATGYLRYALGPLRPVRNAAPGWLFAAGGLAMTASDLARWDIALMQHRVLSEASLQQLTHEVVLQNGAGTRYALGLDVELKHGRRAVGHSGEIDGFTAGHVFYPDDGVAVVALTNQEAVGASGTITDQLASLLLLEKAGVGESAIDRDRAAFIALQNGTLDPSLLTANARSYFSDQARADFKSSLGPLGAPAEFELERSGLRGGFVTRVYRIDCAGRQLEAVVRLTLGGLIEQYTVSAE